MSKTIKELKEVILVYDLSVLTDNSNLQDESIKEMLLLLGKVSDKELSALKETEVFEKMSDKMKVFLENSYLVEKKNIPSFILQKALAKKVFAANVDIPVFQREKLSSKIRSFVHCALHNSNELDRFLEDNHVKFDCLEDNLKESMNDLVANASIYTKNPRFKIEDVVKVILDENASLHFEYTVVDVGEKYIISTKDKDYVKNLLV